MDSSEIVGHILDGKYSIEKQLGKGGMGTVYLSTHIGTGRSVAVKVIAPDFMKRTEFIERFRREARAAGRLRHPNVVDVTDFGFAKIENGDDVAYLVMEYLDGCTLGEVLDEEEKLPVEFSIDILEQVCSAVDEAHKQGIIHRDLKPDNIWLEPNQRGGYTVKVLDFGIAKLEEARFLEAEHQIQHPVSKNSETKFIQNKQTIAGDDQTETFVHRKNSTIISEHETVALAEESKTLVPGNEGAETLVQEIPEIKSSGVTGLEDGTAIFAADQTRGRHKEEDENARQIEEDTDKSLLNSPSTTNLTRVGAVLGTPLYMSPEQCRGETLTARSDIYSLAVIAYQMLSGNLPFTGDYMRVMDGHKKSEPPPLEAKKVPKSLKRIVMRSLSKETAERPETAEAFASKLRSNSEGLWVLLRRAVVIYSERLPKILALAVITFIPLVILTFLRVGINFILKVYEVDSAVAQTFSGIISVASFFLQVVSAALLVGMITWVVAQTLAYPLRPISLRASFREVKKRWKPLAGTVTLSTLLALLSFGVGGVAGALGWAPLIALAFLFTSKLSGIILTGLAVIAGFIFLGVLTSSFFMLIAPSIMMEDVRGKAAFTRSIELVKRSFSTVFATSLLVYVVPIVLSVIIALSIGAVIGNIQKTNEIAQMKKEGVVAEKNVGKPDEDLNISLTGGGLKVTTGDPKDKRKDEEKDMRKEFGKALTEGIFELIWTPLAILITSFTSVITALIYFKTRQAGGESMQELLGKLDGEDKPQSKWQQRVRERLIQSGKITGGSSNPSKS